MVIEKLLLYVEVVMVWSVTSYIEVGRVAMRMGRVLKGGRRGSLLSAEVCCLGLVDEARQVAQCEIRFHVWLYVPW